MEIFKSMGGNIPGENFLREIFRWGGGSLVGGDFNHTVIYDCTRADGNFQILFDSSC